MEPPGIQPAQPGAAQGVGKVMDKAGKDKGRKVFFGAAFLLLLQVIPSASLGHPVLPGGTFTGWKLQKWKWGLSWFRLENFNEPNLHKKGFLSPLSGGNGQCRESSCLT